MNTSKDGAMRIYITLTQSDKTIPFNYQQLITGIIHRWLGKNNDYHGRYALFSFSWLQNVDTTTKGININNESYFFISSTDEKFIKQLVKSILADPIFLNGSKVRDVQIINSREFTKKEHFRMASPILLKRRFGNGKIEHALYNDVDFDALLTENMKRKLEKAGLDSNNIQISVDKTYSESHTKLIEYKGVFNKVNVCPIIIEGTEEQIQFAWCVGLGHSTGIGFGALK